MSDHSLLPRYDPARSYQWNYDHPPAPVEIDVSAVPGEWTFLGKRVDSPLGVPAGPLLNGRWCLYYASLGFDVLTYKTVRSVERACYPLPNLLPVDCGPLAGDEQQVPSSPEMHGSWAVSFGMPSATPDVWRRDVEWTRRQLPAGKLLSVSVVGTVQPGWSLDELADDYARCARWAVESGADCIETNFSCPNVATCDGQLYQHPDDARCVAEAVRAAVGDTPYIVKVGHLQAPREAESLLDALAPTVDALAMTNSVAAAVTTPEGLAFDGERRGICGKATLEASLAQLKMCTELLALHQTPMQLIGVGGVTTVEEVRRYLSSGAHAVHIATAAMVNPRVAAEIKQELAS